MVLPRFRYGIIALSCLILGAIAGVGMLLPRPIVSPLPAGELGLVRTVSALVKEEKTSLGSYPPNQYFPTTTTPTFTLGSDVAVSAKSYAAMDRKTGELLLAKNLDRERLIASVAKIMTALVALHNYSLDTEMLVGVEAAHTGEAYMGLSEGEIVTVEDLLYGLLLPSGNDAAETLAAGLRPGESSHAYDLVIRNRNKFIEDMNSLAQELGMKDTYFFNPTGLDESLRERSTFSTPLDLVALSNYALSNPTFAKMVATYEHIVPFTEGKHKAFFLYNILQFDRTYPGIKGIKPGVTGFAGETLASYLESFGNTQDKKDDRKIILILLESERTRDDAITIYDFLLKQ